LILWINLSRTILSPSVPETVLFRGMKLRNVGCCWSWGAEPWPPALQASALATWPRESTIQAKMALLACFPNPHPLVRLVNTSPTLTRRTIQSGEFYPRRLRRVEVSSSVKLGVCSEWFPACGTGFYDGSFESSIPLLWFSVTGFVVSRDIDLFNWRILRKPRFSLFYRFGRYRSRYRKLFNGQFINSKKLNSL